jgi:hypothetical protein
MKLTIIFQRVAGIITRSQETASLNEIPALDDPRPAMSAASSSINKSHTSKGRTDRMYPQTQSALFGILPPELRNEIFALVLTEYNDPDKLYDRNTFYCRPGCEGSVRRDIALLSTCKRIWAETNGVIKRLFEKEDKAFFLGWSQRRPPGKRAFANKLLVPAQRFPVNSIVAPSLLTNTIRIPDLRSRSE